MKKVIFTALIGVLICLASVCCAYGQASNFRREFQKSTVVLDSTDTDTILVGLPGNRGKALIAVYVKLTELKASAEGDSLTITYVPVFGSAAADTICLYPEKALELYRGPDLATVDCENYDYTDGATYLGKINLGGMPVRYLRFIVSKIANDNDPSNDSTKVTISADID